MMYWKRNIFNNEMSSVWFGFFFSFYWFVKFSSFTYFPHKSVSLWCDWQEMLCSWQVLNHHKNEGTVSVFVDCHHSCWHSVSVTEHPPREQRSNRVHKNRKVPSVDTNPIIIVGCLWQGQQEHQQLWPQKSLSGFKLLNYITAHARCAV